MTSRPSPLLTGAEPLSKLDCDPFERDLLTIARYFFLGYDEPELPVTHRAYAIAVDQWGESLGYPAAHMMHRLVYAVRQCRDGFGYFQPLQEEAQSHATRDEGLLMDVLYHMRRDNVALARCAVQALSFGALDPDVFRTALTLGSRFPHGVSHSTAAAQSLTGRPALRLVS